MSYKQANKQPTRKTINGNGMLQKDWLLIKLCWFESEFHMKIQLTKVMF